MRKSLMGLPLLISALAACGTSATRPAPAPSNAAPRALSGTNGDMSKYIGNWVSSCVKEFGPRPDGSVGFASSITSFHFTAASGTTAEGTLTIENFASQDCSGSPKRAEEKIVVNFAGTVPVIGMPGQSNMFSGVADKIVTSIAGRSDTSSELHIGFFDQFRQLQISSLTYFSLNQLVYVKK